MTVRMSGGILPGMTRKVAISISEELLAEVDAESKATHLSRSRLLGMAAASYLQERRRKRAVEQYVQSYSEHPETDDELKASDAFLRDAWATDD
jgi:metal-responsive CopG/Arc/MetJ family transcriptional regulator